MPFLSSPVQLSGLGAFLSVSLYSANSCFPVAEFERRLVGGAYREILWPAEFYVAGDWLVTSIRGPAG